ncbi:MAG: hypothetical protein ACOZBG_03575 [Candidatus Micrarchaeota archaeon]
MKQTYDILNNAWKSTCKILFGEEIGELKEYEEWLKEYMPIIGRRKSCISGKEVIFAVDKYHGTKNFVSLDEINENKEKSIDPLTINEIKDIDSIITALSEKWEYCGNKILGNSIAVEQSDTVKDSQYILESAAIEKSVYIYSSFQCTNCKYVFGGIRVADGEFIIGGLRGFGKRSFNYYWSQDNSDQYVCSNCQNCNNIIFCFNQINKNYRIGNLQLDKEKYFSLKSKLVSEIRDELKKNKRFPSIFELVPDEKPNENAIKIIESVPKKKEGDMKLIEDAFKSTFKVIFRKDIDGITPYEEWFYQTVPKQREIPKFPLI